MNSLYIHKPDGTYCRFGKLALNLYYCDMRDNEGTLLTIATVKGQKGMFSAIDVKRADGARKFQDTVGFLSTKGLLDMIDNCVMKNIPISRCDVQLTMDIYGPNVNILQEKKVQHQPGPVTMDITPVPCDILNWYS